MALCATTALAGAVPCLCVRGAGGRFGGFGPVPGVVSLSFPPSRPACSALRVAGRPVRVSITLARPYAIPCGLCVPRARSGCPSGSPRVPLSCVCARAPAASAPPPLGGVACAPRVVPALGAGRAVPRGPCPSACPAPVPCSVWRAWGGAVRSRFPPTWLGVVQLAVGRPRGGCLGASGVGRSPGPDCPPSGRAARAHVGRPGSDALPPPTARPLGGLPGPVWGVRGRALSHPRLPALRAGSRGRCGASGVGRSPTPDCLPSGRAAGASVGRPGSDALQPPTARPLGGLPGPVWGVQGRALPHPRLPALWAGCRGQCGASGVGRSPTPDCPPSGRDAGAGVGRPWSDALPPPTARPLGGLLGPLWGVQGRKLSHPRLPALWAGCRGLCGASGVGRSPNPDCPPSGRAAGAGVGRLGSDALPPPTARPLGGLPGPVWGVRGRALSHPRLLALWAGCRGRCGASRVGRSPTPDCPPSGRAAGAGVGCPGSGALPAPTARPLGGLLGPVWGVRSRALSHSRLPALWAGCRGRCRASGVGRSPTPNLLALWAGCRGRCGASGVGRSPTPDCPPSGRAAGAGVGRPGSGALPAPTARPLGGLPVPVWGVWGRTLSQPRLPALWAGCRCLCGASGVERAPTPDCSPSGRAAGAGVGRPGSDALPTPTARPLGGLRGLVWGVRRWTLSHPRLPALWAGCRGRCGASGVGLSPTPDCPPSGRAAGAGVGRPGSDALPPPTARPLGRLLGPVWGVRGRALSHPRLPALWAGCRGQCGASGVGRSPTPDCPPSGRAAGAGVGRPGSGALPPPTARPLGGLPGPVWGVRGRTLSRPRLPALWAGCWCRCGASGVGRSPTPDCSPSGRAAGAGVGRLGSGALPTPTARPLGGLAGPLWGVRGQTLFPSDCPPSGRAAGAGVGRPGSGALPPPTARPLGGLPGPVWGVRGRTPSGPRLPALCAGCRGRCGAPGVGRSPTPSCPPSGRAAGAGVGRPGSDALPPPTARPLGGLPEPVWGVRSRALSHPRLPAIWAGCRGRCGASGVGRSPTPNCPPSERAAGAGVGRPGSDALPPPTARPLGGLPGPVWGVRGRALSHPRLPALWAGCRGRCGASGVGRSPTPNCPPSERAAGAGVGRPGSAALPPSTARPLGGLPGPVWGIRGRTLSHPRLPALWAGCWAAVRVRALLGRVGGAASWARFGAPQLSFGLSCFALCLFGPLRAAVALFVVVVGFFRLLSQPPPCFFFFSFFPLPPSVRPVVSCIACFPAWGALGLGVLLPPPPPFFVFFFALPPSLLSLAFLGFRLPLASAPPPRFFFPVLLFCFLLRVRCVCSGVS